MLNKILKGIYKNLKWIIVLVFILIFFIILNNVMTEEIKQFDDKIYSLIAHTISNNFTVFMKIITNFASPYTLIIITILALIFVKNKKIGICIASNLVISASLNFIIKNIVERSRPVENRIIHEIGYSFPSGHSTVSMAFYGLIIYFICKYVKNKKIRNILCTLLIILIVLIGISRIYLGVHFTSDVFAGFVLGIAYLICFTSVISKLID